MPEHKTELLISAGILAGVVGGGVGLRALRGGLSGLVDGASAKEGAALFEDQLFEADDHLTFNWPPEKGSREFTALQKFVHPNPESLPTGHLFHADPHLEDETRKIVEDIVNRSYEGHTLSDELSLERFMERPLMPKITRPEEARLLYKDQTIHSTYENASFGPDGTFIYGTGER